jgi:hypothetical protein
MIRSPSRERHEHFEGGEVPGTGVLAALFSCSCGEVSVTVQIESWASARWIQARGIYEGEKVREGIFPFVTLDAHGEPERSASLLKDRSRAFAMPVSLGVVQRSNRFGSRTFPSISPYGERACPAWRREPIRVRATQLEQLVLPPARDRPMPGAMDRRRSNRR